jgi:hypothetical protein
MCADRFLEWMNDLLNQIKSACNYIHPYILTTYIQHTAIYSTAQHSTVSLHENTGSLARLTVFHILCFDLCFVIEAGYDDFKIEIKTGQVKMTNL